MNSLNKNDKIYIAGHTGLVGNALLSFLQNEGYQNIICKTHEELDLTDSASVQHFFSTEKPNVVFIAAAKVGGIKANHEFPAEFIYNNSAIYLNIIHQAYLNGVVNLINFGSSCMYPKFCDQPMQEKMLLTGSLEPTNEPYAIAKLLGWKMCESYNRQYGTQYITLIPAGLYGINDNFHPEHCHVIPALIRRFHQAKLNNDDKIVIWGTGKAQREFLNIEDLPSAALLALSNKSNNTTINIGFGSDISIKSLAEMLKKVIGYEGRLEFDHTKPDGMPRKLLNSDCILKLGWKPSIDLELGLQRTYQWFLDNISS